MFPPALIDSRGLSDQMHFINLCNKVIKVWSPANKTMFKMPVAEMAEK